MSQLTAAAADFLIVSQLTAAGAGFIRPLLFAAVRMWGKDSREWLEKQRKKDKEILQECYHWNETSNFYVTSSFKPNAKEEYKERARKLVDSHRNWQKYTGELQG